MTRTPEQIEADDALTAAIERVLAAYTDDGYAWLLSEYVIVSAQHRFAADGESLTAVGVFTRDSSVPLHRGLGLLDYARTRWMTVIAED